MASLKELLSHGDEDPLASIPDYIVKAPRDVRHRISALKKLQLKTIGVQSDFYKRVHELECEFREKFDNINKQRSEIVNGEYEPAENECEEKLFHWMSEADVEKFKESEAINGNEKVKGIPEFWKNTFVNCPGVNEMISEDDEEVLKYLKDVTITQEKDTPSFTLHFHFKENPFFTNTELTKYFKLSLGPNGIESDLLYDGPSIVACKGCKIEWKEGKDITKQLVKKKQKKGNETRQTVKTIEKQSFFNFFSPELREISENMDETEASLLNDDFETGQFIRDSLVDSAVLYYTGECLDDDDDFDFGMEGDEDDDDEDEE